MIIVVEETKTVAYTGWGISVLQLRQWSLSVFPKIETFGKKPLKFK